MKAQSAELFHDTLLSQYREMIDEAVIESEFDHKAGVNAQIFDQKLNQIIFAASLDGVNETEIQPLVREVLFRHAGLKP